MKIIPERNKISQKFHSGLEWNVIFGSQQSAVYDNKQFLRSSIIANNNKLF